MPEENKTVSVDDMMKDLKRKSKELRDDEASKGELVTKADGSTIIKVKRRKRRAFQPRNGQRLKSQKKKIILLSSAITFLLLLGVGYSFIAGYYNSGGFFKKVVASLSGSTGAEAELGSLSVGFDRSELTTLSLNWGDKNSTFKTLKAKNLATDTGALALLTGGWSGSEVNVTSAELQLGYVESGAIKLAKELEFDYDVFLCNTANVKIGDSGEWMLNKTTAIYKINESGEDQINFYGGNFITPLELNYMVSTGVVRLKDDHMDLSLKLVSNKTKGSVLLEGNVGYKKEAEINLKSTFQEVSLKDWIKVKMNRFIVGEITAATGSFRIELGDEDSLQLEINAESEELKIGNFPFIQTLSLELKDDYFTNPNFKDGSSFKLEQSSKTTKFSEISFLQRGHLKVTGEFSLNANDQLSGSLKLGIPVMNLNPVDKEVITTVFNEDDGIFFWATVTLSGTAAMPLDDLDEQIKKARMTAILQQGTDKEKFDILTE